MNVIPVPCLFDNYAYVVFDEGSSQALIIDPSESTPVLNQVDALGLEVKGILCTHHHADHVGGLFDILDRFPNLNVYGHELDADRIGGLSHPVRHEQKLTLAGIEWKVLHVPGHTLGAITWVADSAAFTGDTLFVGGCGRVFEGTAPMMYASLNHVLGELDPKTRVFCGHEYTASNLKFARHAEPSNEAVSIQLEHVRQARARKEPTVPSTLAQEKQINPFLRCNQPGLIAFAEKHSSPKTDPVSVFAALRTAKNRFRG